MAHMLYFVFEINQHISILHILCASGNKFSVMSLIESESIRDPVGNNHLTRRLIKIMNHRFSQIQHHTELICSRKYHGISGASTIVMRLSTFRQEKQFCWYQWQVICHRWSLLCQGSGVRSVSITLRGTMTWLPTNIVERMKGTRLANKNKTLLGKR